MARIGDSPPRRGPLWPPPSTELPSNRAPVWPWGGPRSVRDRLVNPSAFERKRRRKSGDPKSPALASTDLLDFIGPGHTSDELRLPMPPGYGDGSEEFRPFPDRELTAEICELGSAESRGELESALKRLALPPERHAYVMGMLEREARMLEVLERIQADVDEVVERMKAECKANGSY
jgi:hypothetical protein